MRSVSLLIFGLMLEALFANFADAADPVATVTDYRSAWHKLAVPGTWDELTGGVLANFDGIAWYRCEVKVPAEWQGAQVSVATEQVDNAHEVYFNGAKIGGAGAFPPKYESGLKEAKRLVVPAEHVRFGEANVVAIRIYDDEGKGGFKGAAPSVTAGLQTIRLEGKWDFKIAAMKSQISNSKPQISEEELASFAARVDDSNKAKLPASVTLFSNILASPHGAPVGKAPEDVQPVVPPEKALATFTVPDDLKLELVLSEPEVKQPLFMTWDERGRLWVVQYLQYPYPAGLKMVSRDTFWRAVYDKVPPPPPHGEPGLDKITIHEDTDGDGKLDKHKTFLDGLNIATSFAFDRDGVWVLNPPYLLFYHDRNHDDVPDGDPEVHLQGFGLEDTHSVANSLRWGPDGWLYGCQGSTTSSAITRPGIDKQPVHSMGQLIWRYHPATRRFEIFSEGGGNSFGCEFDSEGRVFSGHNGGDTRGFHYTQGGYYQKGFNKHGPLSNPFAYGYFNMMKHAAVPRFTHNFVIYAGAELPEKYNGHLFGVEPLQGRVVEADFFADRSSFQTKDLGYTITSTDKRFRPVEIKTGPDGAIYVADMYEPQIAHRQHFQGIIDKDNGRIYRIVAKGSKAVVRTPTSERDSSETKATRPDVGVRTTDASGRPTDFGKLTTTELIDVLKSPNKFHRQTALRLIGQRHDRSVLPQLTKSIDAGVRQFQLECLWATYQLGGLDEPFAQQLLSHKEPLIREWTARLIGDMPLDFAAQVNAAGRITTPGPRQAQEDHLIAHRFAETRVAPATASKLAEVAKSETYVRVRSQLASTAKRLPADQALPLIDALLTHNEDADDIHIPLLLWWAVESKATKHSTAILALLKEADVWKRPLVEKVLLSRLMQRYAQAGSRNDLLVAAELLAKAPSAEHKKELLRGFEDAFKGRPLSGLPDELVAQITQAGGGSLALRVRQKDAAAIDEAMKLVAQEFVAPPASGSPNKTNPPPKGGTTNEEAKTRRIELVQTLGEIQPPGSRDMLLKLVKSSADNDVRSAALTALLGFKDDVIGSEVVSVYRILPLDVQSVALTLLTSRPIWARHFVEAIDANKLKADAIPMDVVRKLTFLKDDTLVGLVKKHWPKLEGASTAEMQEQIAKFAPIAKSEGGVAFDGKKIFMQSCGKCHLLFGEGGRIGPDLTTFKRDDVNHILTNVINPSAEIREGFESLTVVTTDGRTITGFRADQDARLLVLRGIDGQNIPINRDDIEEIVPSKKSLMPEGLLNNLSEQQVRDLFTYLRIGQPLNSQ